MSDSDWDIISSGKAPTASQGHKKPTGALRKAPRYVVPWEIAIVASGTVHSAVVADISIDGVSLFLDRNFRQSDKFAITIKIPTYNGLRELIVGAECSLLYSLLSSEMYGKFRIGFRFLNFRKNGRRDLLEAFSTRVAIGGHPGACLPSI